MVKMHNAECVIKVLKELRKDDYSPLWWVVDDMSCNGHVIKVKDSTLWGHVIIDNSYVDIRPEYLFIDVNGNKYEDIIDYIAKLLNTKKEGA